MDQIMLEGTELREAIANNQSITEAMVLSSRVVLIDFGESFDVIDRPQRPLFNTLPITRDSITPAIATSGVAAIALSCEPIVPLALPSLSLPSLLSAFLPVTLPLLTIEVPLFLTTTPLSTPTKAAITTSAAIGTGTDVIDWKVSISELSVDIGRGLTDVYHPPEVRNTTQLGEHVFNYEKCDIYSLGIVLLEMVTARRELWQPTLVHPTTNSMLSLLHASRTFSSSLIALLSTMVDESFDHRCTSVMAYNTLLTLCRTCGRKNWYY
jgi:serine/threonine protein kinase